MHLFLGSAMAEPVIVAAELRMYSIWLSHSEFMHEAQVRKYHGLWEAGPRRLSAAEALEILQRAPTKNVVRKLPSGIFRCVRLHQMVVLEK